MLIDKSIKNNYHKNNVCVHVFDGLQVHLGLRQQQADNIKFYPSIVPL